MYHDTIAAIATPPGEGAIGVVRLSGPSAGELAARLFRMGRRDRRVTPDELESHRLFYGTIVDPESERKIDEVMLVRMAQPRSYTREETVEISCHGGWTSVREVLALCLREGARHAEPGEFTLRAFLNGRIDLSQAEAVAGVVSARTPESLSLAVEELRGSLTARLRPARDRLVETLAYLDAAADFPDDEIPAHDVSPSLDAAAEVLASVIESANTGLLYREGVRVAIVGRPNVGKSSLLNALLGTDRAIVTEVAGTTRDVISETVNLGGVPATLIDTAGITETADIVERIGIERSRQEATTSGLILFVMDRSEPLREQDRLVADLIRPRVVTGDVVVVLNKCDLPAQIGRTDVEVLLGSEAVPFVEVSTKSRQALDELRQVLQTRLLPRTAGAAEPALVTLRQYEALRRSAASVEAARLAWRQGIPLDLLAVDVRAALQAVGEVTGEQVSEAVLDEIFSRFCIGK